MGVFSGVFGVRWNWMGSYDSTVKQQLFRVETGRADWNVAAITVRAGISTAAKTGEGGGGRGLWKGRGGEFYQFWPLFCAAGSPALQYTSTVKQDHYCGLKEVWEGDSLSVKRTILACYPCCFSPSSPIWALSSMKLKICRTVLESSVPSTTHRTQGSPSSQISGVTRITHQRALGKISQFNKFNLYSQISL